MATYLTYAGGSSPPPTTWVGDRSKGLHPTLNISEQAWLHKVMVDRGYTCEVSGQQGIELAVHHLANVAHHPELRWTDSNVIVVARTLHVEFHSRYMGGFHVGTTPEDWANFVTYKMANGGIDAPLVGYESLAEAASREEHIRIYRSMAGLRTLPADKQYWSPVYWATDKPTSQVNQMVGSGLITVGQFHGTSEHERVIEHNRALHPAAHWSLGNWSDVIFDSDDFNPGLVYLDTKCLSGKSALGVTAYTMHLCPPQTVLVVGVLQFSYLQEVMEPAEFINELDKRVPAFHAWVNAGAIENYSYERGEIKVQTYAFKKGVADEDLQ